MRSASVPTPTLGATWPDRGPREGKRPADGLGEPQADRGPQPGAQELPPRQPRPDERARAARNAGPGNASTGVRGRTCAPCRASPDDWSRAVARRRGRSRATPRANPKNWPSRSSAVRVNPCMCSSCARSVVAPRLVSRYGRRRSSGSSASIRPRRSSRARAPYKRPRAERRAGDRLDVGHDRVAVLRAAAQRHEDVQRRLGEPAEVGQLVAHGGLP